MTPHSDRADISTLTSILGAVISITSIQPIVTLMASLVAIVSGLFAIRYYYKAIKNIK
jgi:hypothetical protein